MKIPAALSVLALALATAVPGAAASQTVTLKPSSLSFKQALSECSGALGAVTFTLSHARVASAPGVSEETDTSATGVDEITLTAASGKSATAVINAHEHTVAAQKVQVESDERVACIMPD